MSLVGFLACRPRPHAPCLVDITAAKDSVRFSAKGDLGAGNIILRSSGSVDKDETSQTKITMRKPVTISVSVKFLSAFTKATSLSPTVKLEIIDKQPMMVEYSLGEVGYLRFYLAPKLGDDE